MKGQDIQDSLSALIRHFLKENDLDEIFKEGIELQAPRLREFGDLTCNIAFKLSKVLKQSPQKIASQLSAYLKDEVNKTTLKEKIEEIEPQGKGFINFLFTKKYFYEGLSEILSSGTSFGKQNIGKGKSVLIEFVSANPTGPLSIAHARQAAVGDSLSRILSFLGFRVKKEYYVNDEGHQIDVLGESVRLRLKELMGEKIDFPEDGYQGEYIYDIAKAIKNQNSEFISEYALNYILEDIKKDLKDFGVEFDCWMSQKKLRESADIKKVLDKLRGKGFIYDRDGAVWFKSSSFGDDKDRVVIKSDGSYTYLAPDIAYHEEKYRRNFKWLINIWGPDHHGYINRLKAAVSALGKDKKSLDIIIIQLATIFREGKPVPMSTRRAQYITLREVLNEVGRDAARFFFLMRKVSSHLNFDLTLAKQHTPQNPVFYIQYAYARINSILEKAKEYPHLPDDITKMPKKINFSHLNTPEELWVLRTLMQFPYALKVCYESLDPYNLTVYLQDLATDFHKFYDLHRVLSEDKDLSLARLGLCLATKIVLDNGLKIMGVSSPERM